jgi:hypothetical protein
LWDKLLYSSLSKTMSCVISQHIKSVFIIFKSVPWYREFPWALKTNNNHLARDWHCMQDVARLFQIRIIEYVNSFLNNPHLLMPLSNEYVF